MKRRYSLALACVFLAAPLRAEVAVQEVTVDPATVQLRGPGDRCTLLVHGKTADGRLIDLTGSARFRAAQPKIASVSENGVIRSVADGDAQVSVEVAGRTLTVPVKV